MRSINKILTTFALLAGPVAVDAATIYADRDSFVAAVGLSITDNFSEYGATSGTPKVLTDAQMSAVLGQTRFQALTFPNENLVGYNFSHATSYEYCAGCNGGFRMYYNATSVSTGGGVYGVGFNVDLNRSPVNEIGVGPPGTPGTLVVAFTDGTSLDVTIPADIGFYAAGPYYVGITDPRGIASITANETGVDNRSWIISDLTIAASTGQLQPTVSPIITGTLGRNGWYISAQTILTWTVTGDPVPVTSGCGRVSVPQTKGKTYTCSATNSLGSANDSVMIKKDSIKPQVTVNKPGRGTTYKLHQKVLAMYSCLDATSGIATCSGTVANGAAINTFTTGTKTFTVVGTDKAGNRKTNSVLYSVK